MKITFCQHGFPEARYWRSGDYFRHESTVPSILSFVWFVRNGRVYGGLCFFVYVFIPGVMIVHIHSLSHETKLYISALLCTGRVFATLTYM